MSNIVFSRAKPVMTDISLTEAIANSADTVAREAWAAFDAWVDAQDVADLKIEQQVELYEADRHENH